MWPSRATSRSSSGACHVPDDCDRREFTRHASPISALILRSAPGTTTQRRKSFTARASRRMGAATARAASCFETHRSATGRVGRLQPVGAAMLSMRRVVIVLAKRRYLGALGSSPSTSAATFVPITPIHLKITNSAPLETSAMIAISKAVDISKSSVSMKTCGGSARFLAAGSPCGRKRTGKSKGAWRRGGRRQAQSTRRAAGGQRGLGMAVRRTSAPASQSHHPADH